MTDLIVTLDGPGGTGKSTVSRALAQRLELPHLDTGAFYRAATLAALRAEVNLGDARAVSEVVGNVTFVQEDGRMRLNDEDISAEIRGEEVTAHVSRISAHPEVRALLVEVQRQWVARHQQKAVVEGRDIGTVVFPDATVKIYLDARPEVRAERRSLQAGETKQEALDDLRRRDQLDSSRSASPLQVPPDAFVIDTSDMTFDEVVDQVSSIVILHSG